MLAFPVVLCGNYQSVHIVIPGWKGMCRCAVFFFFFFGGYCLFWQYTTHYTQLTTKFIAGHAQARTSVHKHVGTNDPKVNGNGVLTAH